MSWENEIIIEKRKQLKKLAQMENRNATRANVRKHKEAQKDLQLVTKYLRLALIFIWNSTPQEKFNRYFLGLFC